MRFCGSILYAHPAKKIYYYLISIYNIMDRLGTFPILTRKGLNAEKKSKPLDTKSFSFKFFIQINHIVLQK